MNTPPKPLLVAALTATALALMSAGAMAAMPPHGLPHSQAASGWKSNSSLGGSATAIPRPGQLSPGR
jgi:hypothetical protein